MTRNTSGRWRGPNPFVWAAALLRWLRTPPGLVASLVCGALFFMAFGYIAIGYVVGRVETAERVRLYAAAVLDNGLDWVDRKLRGDAAIEAQAAAWEPVRSELHDLEINSIALKPRPTRAGAMTQLGGLLLATTAHARFVTLDPQSGAVAGARIASPLNLDAFRADPLWNVPGLDRQYFRINDIIAVGTGESAYDLYATHYWFERDCIQWRLSKTEIHLRGGIVAQSGAWKMLFQAKPCFPVMTEYSAFYLPYSGNLSGGRMLDYDADHLLMTVGDVQAFEARGVDVSQDPQASLGKFLLVNKTTGETSVYATGSRNAQGLARDSKGRIWASEHGPHGGDELNLVRPGANLGWPLVTYGVNYDHRPWPGATREGAHDRFVRPVFAWLPSIGVTSVAEAPGDAFPNWRGDLLVGSLTANTLFRVRLEGEDAIYAEPIRFGGRAIRDMEILPDGRIALLDNRMSVLFIRNGAGFGKSKRYNSDTLVAPRIAIGRLPKARATTVALGEVLYARRCAECHSLTGAAGAGPQLRNVAGRRVASEAGFTYSQALTDAGGVWSEASLARYIFAPESFGAVAMSSVGLEKKDAAAVAAYLTELRRQDRGDAAARLTGR